MGRKMAWLMGEPGFSGTTRKYRDEVLESLQSLSAGRGAGDLFREKI